MTVEVFVNGKRVQIIAGDHVDLGVDGLIVFYPEPEAQAVHVLHEEHQRQVREAAEFTRVKKE